MKVIKFAGILVIATLLLASMAWTQDAAAASEPRKNLVDRLRDAGRSLKESLAQSGPAASTSPQAGPVAVAGATAMAEPSPAQQKAMEAYAASQASPDMGVYTEVSRSVVADLDGDGKPEVVAEINSYMGNSHFGRLVVFVESGNGLRKVAQSEDPLGLVDDIGVADGLIQVKSRWPAPNDARCCPSLEKTAHYRWQGDKVVEAVTAAAPAKAK